MTEIPGKPVALWLDRDQDPSPPPLQGDERADVAVVGGGIVGAATALLLAERGIGVTLVEARAIAGGVTGHSTAKVTALHETTLLADHPEGRVRGRRGVRPSQPRGARPWSGAWPTSTRSSARSD